jgi:hypothetical protein
MIRVEVVTHFNEDSFSYGLAHGLADRLRGALKDVECEAHDEENVVRVGTRGEAQVPNDLTVEIVGCCPSAIRKTERIVEEVLAAAEGEDAGP